MSNARRSLIVLQLLAAAVMGSQYLCVADAATEEVVKAFDIPAKALAEALADFSRQGDVIVVAPSALTSGKRSQAVSGAMAPAEALERLLGGTELNYVREKDGSVILQTLVKEKRVDEMRLAQNESSSSSPPIGENAARANDISEVIVTAQKRSERLQDVPVPVSVVSAQTLVDSNMLRLRDYYTSIPGLNIAPAQFSQQTISIRGITTGSGNPSVGVLIDDVPVGASTNNGGGRIFPDLDPSELSQLEVLRGPQGALYGAASMGGLIKFVTRDPSFDGVSGRVQMGTNTVSHGAGLGSGVRTGVNVPINDQSALYISGFTREDAGYIDDPGRALDGANKGYVSGGRASYLWKPAGNFSLKIGALLQRSTGKGTSDADFALPDLQQSRLPGTGEYGRTTRLYTANIKTALAGVDVTSVTGYSVNSIADSFDFTFSSGAAAAAAFGAGGRGVRLQNDNRTTKFTQELRSETDLSEHFDLLVGLYYSSEHSKYVQPQYAVNPATGAQVGRLSYVSFPTGYKDYAVFGNLTYHVTDRFDLQMGLRKSRIEQTYTSEFISLANAPVITPLIETSADALTYLLTPSFKLSPDVLLYARLASGYRAGGPNIVGANVGIIPPSYEPDKTQNYEIGMKGSFFQDLLSFEASVYYIDWKEIQFTVFNTAIGASYMTNGSRAKSEGIEVSGTARPWAGMTISGFVSYNIAEITDPLPTGTTVVATPGSALPNSASWTGNLAVDQRFPLSGALEGFVGASWSYVDDRRGQFRPAGSTRQLFPSYNKLDLRAGVQTGPWTVSAYATNIQDERGILYGGTGAIPPTSFYYIQPRTIGLSLARTF